jgi:hypothetical protein
MNHTAVLIPRHATLEGFLQSTTAGEGINLHDLEPLTTLIVRTCNTSYRIIVSCKSAILVQGGRYFPDTTTAHLDGSSAGGSFLKMAWIGVGMRMEISVGERRIITSPVCAIATEPCPSVPA